MLNKAVVAWFKGLSRHFPGWTDANHEKLYPISRPIFEFRNFQTQSKSNNHSATTFGWRIYVKKVKVLKWHRTSLEVDTRKITFYLSIPVFYVNNLISTVTENEVLALKSHYE